MKTLKKTLCLVLAVVMAVGVLVIPANAATSFPDDADITHDEAVAVLSGLGILKGDDEGNFNPEGTLTRAEAAVIMARIALTPDGLDDYVASEVPFDDVAGTSYEDWAGSAIAYCVANGIIGGVGNNKYDPAGLLTGHAFAKMLLCALGYDGGTEGFGTADWKTAVENIARYPEYAGDVALNNGLKSFNYGANLSRDSAAQMAYNAMQNHKVKYTGGTTIEVGGITINQGATRDDVDATIAGNYELETLDKDAIADPDQTATDKEDAFGRAYTKKVLDADGEVLYAEQESPIFSYTARKSNLVSTGDLKDYTGTSIALYENGAPQTAISKSDLPVKTGNGVVVEIYGSKSSKTITKVIVISYELAQITDITDDDVDLKAVNSGNITVEEDEDDPNPIYAALAAKEEKDYVMVAVNDGSVVDVADATVVEGKLVAVGTGGSAAKKSYYTIDKKYSVAAKAPTSWSTGEEPTFGDVIAVVDQFGYICDFVDAEQAAKEVNSILVTGFYEIYDEYGTPTNMFQGVLPDGEVVTGEYAGAQKGDNDAPVACTYEFDSDGKYVFTEAGNYTGTASAAGVYKIQTANTVTASTTRLKSSSSANIGNYFDSNVMFIKVDGTKADLDVSTKTGLQKVDVKVGDIAVITKNANGVCVVTAVYLLDGDYAAAEISGDELLYINSTQKTGSALAADGKTPVDVYTGYLNGEKIEDIIVKDTTSVTAGWNSYTINEETGIYTLEHVTSNVEDGKANVTITYVNDTYYMVDGDNEYDATDANILDLSDATTKVTSVDDLADLLETNTGVTISYAYDDDVVTMIYVTNQGEVSE